MLREFACALIVAASCTLARGQVQMAITFDDLPAHGALPAGLTRLDIAESLLKTIKAERLPPVYGFLNGVAVEKDGSTEAFLKAWREAGEPLGNHSWSHPDLSETGVPAFEADIAKNEPLLRKWMGSEDWHWFRYPYLHEGDTVEKRRAVRAYLAAHGYRIASVNMDFEDYLWNAPYARCLATNDIPAITRLHDSYLATADRFFSIFRELSKRLYDRDVRYILLLHAGAFDARMLPELLALYRARGVSFISLPEADRDPAYRGDPDQGLKDGGAQLEQMAARRGLKMPAGSKPYDELEKICR